MTPEEIGARLREEGARTQAFLAALPPEAWDRPVTEEWAVRDVVAHLIRAEEALTAVCRRFLEGRPLRLEGFDLDRWNREQVALLRDRPPEALREGLAQARRATLAFLADRTEAELEVQGVHPVFGQVPIRLILRQIYRHERNHRRQIQEALE